MLRHLPWRPYLFHRLQWRRWWRIWRRRILWWWYVVDSAYEHLILSTQQAEVTTKAATVEEEGTVAVVVVKVCTIYLEWTGLHSQSTLSCRRLQPGWIWWAGRTGWLRWRRIRWRVLSYLSTKRLSPPVDGSMVLPSNMVYLPLQLSRF